jgi:hypothetical protein
LALRWNISPKSKRSGETLMLAVGQRDEEAVVCYGIPYGGELPSLNKEAGEINKEQQGRLLSAAGIGIDILNAEQATNALRNEAGPLLARKARHKGGKDIMVCLSQEDPTLRVHAGAAYFTPWLDIVREYRVWIFRRRHLGTYEKILKRPEEYRKIGRNYDNGFSFSLVRSEDINRATVDLASKAVEVLHLDFGAVDVAIMRDGAASVLEVNSAPGVESSDRQALKSLARRINRWLDNGCKKRKNQ